MWTPYTEMLVVHPISKTIGNTIGLKSLCCYKSHDSFGKALCWTSCLHRAGVVHRDIVLFAPFKKNPNATAYKIFVDNYVLWRHSNSLRKNNMAWWACSHTFGHTVQTATSGNYKPRNNVHKIYIYILRVCANNLVQFVILDLIRMLDQLQ